MNPLFANAEIFNVKGIFTYDRIKNDVLRSLEDQGLYCYQIRHTSNGSIASLEKRVLVDYYGTFISKDPVDFKDKDFLNMSGKNINVGRFDTTLDDYINS